jgi:hypothetical protein
VRSSSCCRASASPVKARSRCPGTTVVDSSLTCHAPFPAGESAALQFIQVGAVSCNKSGLGLSLVAVAAGVMNGKQRGASLANRWKAWRRCNQFFAVCIAQRGAFGPSDSRQGAAGC